MSDYSATLINHLRSTLGKMEVALGAIGDSIVWTDSAGKIQWSNATFDRLVNRQRFDILGANLLDILPLEEQGKNLSSEAHPLTRILKEQLQTTDIYEFRQADKKLILEISSASIQFKGQDTSAVLVIHDITDRKRAEEQLLHNAFHDPLTGLPNRALFMDRLGCAVEHAKRQENYLFAVLFIDLDRFKVINDSLGHTFGDQLLIGMASRLEACLRPTDTVARLGGDEFTILLEDVKDVSDAVRVAERIQAELRLPFDLGGQEVFTAASIGIALSTRDYDKPEALLRDADIAMYRAKALGKARYEVFNLGMHTRAMALLQLETDLRLAIERGEFQIHYQPIVSLKTGTITGFEALLRWQHPVRGFISPAEFIPVAEETGLIIPIGNWVLREACYQICAWQARFPANPPLTVSVNISGKQFSQPDLIEQIRQILQETNLAPQSLRLEITESVLMENTESAVSMLLQLKAMNIQLYMDDFGTGYSSLSYLHRFPIDTLKIDRSFISTTNLDGRNSGIVQTIIMLAHNLGMDVIAEGIETQLQLAFLKTLGCEYGQGYFFSKPVVAEVAEVLIAKQGVFEGSAFADNRQPRAANYPSDLKANKEYVSI